MSPGRVSTPSSLPQRAFCCAHVSFQALGLLFLSCWGVHPSGSAETILHSTARHKGGLSRPDCQRGRGRRPTQARGRVCVESPGHSQSGLLWAYEGRRAALVPERLWGLGSVQSVSFPKSLKGWNTEVKSKSDPAGKTLWSLSEKSPRPPRTLPLPPPPPPPPCGISAERTSATRGKNY